MPATSFIGSRGLTRWPNQIEIETNFPESTSEELAESPTTSGGSLQRTSVAGTDKLSLIDTVAVKSSDGQSADGYNPEGKSSLTLKFGFGFDGGSVAQVGLQIQPIWTEPGHIQFDEVNIRHPDTIDRGGLDDIMTKEESFERQLVCLLECLREAVNTTLRPKDTQIRPRLPRWESQYDERTGTYPYPSFMEDTLHSMLDKAFENAKKRMLTETAAETCKGIMHVVHQCDCKKGARHRQTVLLRYGKLITVQVSF